MSLFAPLFRGLASGDKLYFYTTGTLTPASVYTTSDLSVAHANPVVADATGAFAPIYLDPAVTYRVIHKTAAGAAYPNGDIDPLDHTAADLLASTGADKVGKTGGGTVQDALDDLLGTNLGAIPDGVGSDLTVSRSFSGVGSSSGLYGENNQIRGYGSLDIGSIRAAYFGANVDTTAGTTALAESAHFFTWVKNTGNVTVAKVVEAHLVAGRDDNAVDKSGTITSDATYFNCAGITLGTTITIPKVTGFNVGQIVSTTQVTNGYGYNCEHNQTTAAGGQFAGYRSQVRAATGSWSFLANANTAGVEAAPAGFTGKVSIGNDSGTGGILDPFTPSYMLDVKATADDWSARVGNRSGGTPSGLYIDLTFATPNATQMLLAGACSGTFTFKVFTNGNVVNTNNSYGAISDKRLKTGIRDATPQLADIRELKVRKYRLKSDPEGPELLGLVAQEAEKVSPGLVFEGEDGMKGVNYSVLYMKAVKALQELADMVEAQDRRIKALEARA